MTQTVSSRFLQRIAAYPVRVQQILQSAVTEASLGEYVRVLHASAPDRNAGAQTETLGLTDALLSRLVRSKRFLARVSQFQDLLNAADPVAAAPQIGEFFVAMIAPLADLESPYYHKLVEVTKADPPEPALAVLGPLVEMLDLFRTLGAAKGRPDLLLARLILQAGQDGNVSVLNAMMALLNQPPAFRTPTVQEEEEASVLSRETLIAFLRGLLRYRSVDLTLEPVDLDCLRAISQTRTPGYADVLLPPVPLELVLTGPASAGDLARWSALAEDGLIDHIATEPSDPAEGAARLTLPAALQMSPIALAWLRAIELPQGLVRILVERQPHRQGWAEHITGYPEEGEIREEVGLLLRPGAEEGMAGHGMVLARQIDIRKNRGQLRQMAPVSPTEAYAFVLRLSETVAVQDYLNIENCLVFDDIAALTAALAPLSGPLSARMGRKPVVILGPASPALPSYIVESVSRFWSYGGRYVTSAIAVAYDGLTGALTLSLPKHDQLTRLVLAAAATLPLTDLLQAPDRLGAQLRQGLLTLTEGFGVCHSSALPAGEEVLSRLLRSLNTARMTAAEHEALFLVGSVDHRSLTRQDGGAGYAGSHWPIEPLIMQIVQKYQRLRGRLTAFPEAPSVEAAQIIVTRLADPATETSGLSDQIAAFVVSLAQHPTGLLGLEPDKLIAFFALARQSRAADTAAAALSSFANQICQKDLDLIIPLFEFLSCCLPRAQVQTTLAFIAMGGGSNRRYMFRVAECLRRYGDDTLMALVLPAALARDKDLLNENAFARCFLALLDSPRRAAVQAAIGAEAMRKIAATQSFQHRFHQAVLAGDRALMERLVIDPVQDFTTWMNGLRALSNELRALDLSPFPVIGISGLHRRKLAATIFSDRATLQDLARQAFLDGDADVDVIAQNILGNNAPLNRAIARRFDGTDAQAMTIDGSSVTEVFARASAGLAGLVPGSAATGPRVSVIMSAFNPDVDLMRLAILSVLAQTHGNTEIFVVDDASEMASSRRIQQMLTEFPQIDYTRLDVNCGPYVGRNLAIAKATGDFIAIQDADDWSHPQRFAAQLAAFAATPELRLVTTPHVRIDRAGCVQMEADFSIFGDGPMSSMFPRAIFAQIGGFAGIRSRGDIEMRERIRAYYGTHSIRELAMPAMLCFADSATLSQKTKTEAAEYLQLFRTNISQRRGFTNMRRDGQRLGADQAVTVPAPLRPDLKAEDIQ